VKATVLSISRPWGDREGCNGRAALVGRTNQEFKKISQERVLSPPGLVRVEEFPVPIRNGR
jgi:glucokinase